MQYQKIQTFPTGSLHNLIYRHLHEDSVYSVTSLRALSHRGDAWENSTTIWPPALVSSLLFLFEDYANAYVWTLLCRGTESFYLSPRESVQAFF